MRSFARAATLMALGCFCICGRIARADDAYEENDTRETAARVDLPLSATLRSCPVDNDWFSFPVSQGGEIEVEATFRHSSGNIDIYLYDPADELAASSTSATDDEGIIHTAGAKTQLSVWVQNALSINSGGARIMIAKANAAARRPTRTRARAKQPMAVIRSPSVENIE